MHFAGVGQTGTWDAGSADPEGIGVDPVFQLYSYLWDLDLYGDERQYYNMTKVCFTAPRCLASYASVVWANCCLSTRSAAKSAYRWHARNLSASFRCGLTVPSMCGDHQGLTRPDLLGFPTPCQATVWSVQWTVPISVH